MANIVDFPKKKQGSERVLDEASLWIAKMSRGLTDEEQLELRGWLSEKSHRDMLFKMSEIWDKMDELNRLADLFPAPLPSARSRSLRKIQRVFVPGGRSIAAVMLLFVGLSLLINFGAFHSDDSFEKTLVTAKGEISTLTLSDGSRLVLNTDGRVRVRYSRQQRLFILDRGELSIEVAHDKNRPLNVVAGNKIVQAIGTAFNMYMRNNQEVELIVTEGKVRVEDAPSGIEMPLGRLPETAMTIARGEKIVLGTQQKVATPIADADIAVDLGWQKGNLIFRGETLEQALAEVSRYTDVEFEIQGDSLRNKQIAGLFQIGDISGLLSALDSNFQIHSERVKGKIVLAQK